MFFAVIGDILSNFSGLKYILDSLDKDGIHRVIQTGNVCGEGVAGEDCIALLRSRQVVCVQGRLDKIYPRVANSLQKKRTHADEESGGAVLDSASIEYLHTLPRKRLLTEEKLRILVCHGAINRSSMILDHNTPRAVFQRQRELEPVDVVITGGALEPFYCFVDTTLFVMPGIMRDAGGAVRYTLVDTEVWPPSARTVTL